MVHGAATARAITPAQALARPGTEARSNLRVVAGAAPRPEEEAAPDPVTAEALKALASFDDVVGLIRDKRDARLLTDVERGLRLVSYAPGRIAFQPSEKAPRALAADLSRRLQDWTGVRWIVSITQGAAAPTIAETRDAAAADMTAALRRHPLVAAALAAFPGAEIKRTAALVEADPGGEKGDPGAEDDPWDDWEPVDPFDDEPI